MNAPIVLNPALRLWPALLGGLLLVAPAAAQSSTLAPRAVVEKLDDAILKLGGKRLNGESERAVFEPVIRDVFDMARIAAASIGIRRWRSWSAEQRREYQEQLINYMLTLYLDRFREYQGGGLKIEAVETEDKRTLVRTRLAVPDQKDTQISFLLIRRAGRWRIADVFFRGAISEVANLRAQFAKILEEKGREGLLAEMQDFTARVRAP